MSGWTSEELIKHKDQRRGVVPMREGPIHKVKKIDKPWKVMVTNKRGDGTYRRCATLEGAKRVIDKQSRWWAELYRDLVSGKNWADKLYILGPDDYDSRNEK